MSRPAEVRGNVHPEELKRFHRFNNRTSYRYWLTVATIIMQKINPHQLALTRVQLHVVTMSEAVNVIYKVFHYRRRVARNYLQYSANLNPSRLYALILSTSSHASEPWFSLLETSQSWKIVIIMNLSFITSLSWILEKRGHMKNVSAAFDTWLTDTTPNSCKTVKWN